MTVICVKQFIQGRLRWYDFFHSVEHSKFEWFAHLLTRTLSLFSFQNVGTNILAPIRSVWIIVSGTDWSCIDWCSFIIIIKLLNIRCHKMPTEVYDEVMRWMTSSCMRQPSDYRRPSLVYFVWLLLGKVKMNPCHEGIGLQQQSLADCSWLEVSPVPEMW